MEDGRKGKKILSLWIFCAMIGCVVLIPCVIFIIRQTVYFRLEQRKEQADFFTIAENISWRGFELFCGKNPTGYHFVQMDSVFFYESEYTKKEFSQFMEQNRIQKMNSEEVVLDYKHFLKGILNCCFFNKRGPYLKWNGRALPFLFSGNGRVIFMK